MSRSFKPKSVFPLWLQLYGGGGSSWTIQRGGGRVRSMSTATCAYVYVYVSKGAGSFQGGGGGDSPQGPRWLVRWGNTADSKLIIN